MKNRYIYQKVHSLLGLPSLFLVVIIKIVLLLSSKEAKTQCKTSGVSRQTGTEQEDDPNNQECTFYCERCNGGVNSQRPQIHFLAIKILTSVLSHVMFLQVSTAESISFNPILRQHKKEHTKELWCTLQIQTATVNKEINMLPLLPCSLHH